MTFCHFSSLNTLKPSAMQPHCALRHPLLVSLVSAVEEEPGSNAANQKASNGKNGGEPNGHAVRAVWVEGLGRAERCGAVGCGCWPSQAVHLCEDVWMLLKNTRESWTSTSTCCQISHKWVNGSFLTSVGHLMLFLAFVKLLYVCFSPTGSNLGVKQKWKFQFRSWPKCSERL